MPFKTYKEASKGNYGTQHGDNAEPTFAYEQLNLGCFQRIADASEAMAKNYVNMQHDLDCYRRWYKEEQQRVAHRDKVIAGLRGQITKLKKKIQ